MKSFHSDIKVKEKYLKRVKAHAVADEIIKGRYWVEGKGCAVGCTIHSNNHNAYESELGIPEWLARVEDTIFEGLPNEKAKSWPQYFLESIPIGKDLNQIKVTFIIFILESNTHFDRKKFPDAAKAIDDILVLYKAGKTPQTHIEEFVAAESAAWSARSAARAAESAARSAESAGWSAESAARAASRSAAWSAESAAKSASWSIRSAAYEKFADKLLELLRGVK